MDEKRRKFLRSIARKGGLATKAKMLAKDPHYFSKIGTKGGNKILAERGTAFYSEIGSIGKR